MNILQIAAVVVILMGLKFFAPFLVYFILSVFLTILVYPLVNFFEKRGFGVFVGYFISALIFLLIFSVMFMIITSSLREFVSNASIYKEKLTTLIIQFNSYLSEYNLKLDISLLSGIDFVGTFKLFLAKVSGLLSGFLVVFIGVSFMIFESKNFGKKLSLITKNKDTFEVFFKNTQKYYLIKTFTSALTGILVTIMLLYFDVSYAYLFGILSFLFNYIPVVGSIVASIGGMVMALMVGFDTFVYVSIWYVVINNFISNILEPKILGDGLDLSAGVVFFSLLFWGWIFGIVGMLLAAPLTMTLKLALLSNKKTKWIGILLSK